MTADGWIVDAGVGETRAARLVAGKAVELRVIRPGEEGRRAQIGEIYAARVRAVEPALRGAFLDLGLADEAAFLRAPAQEGELVSVRVVREAARGKGPVVRPEPWEAALPERPSRLAAAAEPFLVAGPFDPGFRAALDEAFESALSRDVALPGGGMLRIEPTAALVAVDVDAAGRTGAGGDPERFALALNLAAATAAFGELRRRHLGGLAAIDFVSLRKPQSRAALAAALAALARADSADTILAPLSRFGVAEISRPQTYAPLHERMAGDGPAAWALLRAVEREAQHARGRIVAAEAGPRIVAALAAGGIDWRGELTGRIGARWTLEVGADLAPTAARVYLKDR